MTNTSELTPMLEGLARLLATSSRDWGQYAPDAWLYAVICGWDCEETEHDETCTHGAMEEMAERHGWDEATVAKARRYRAAVRAVVEPPADQTTPSHRAALRDRITTAISKWHRDPEQPLYEQGADAVLAVLPEPADRAAVLAEAADAIDAETRQAKADGVLEPDKYRPCRDASAQLRRMADETATETPEPHRGDAFEQWLKARRDEWAPEGCQPWQILDQTLEEYRLHADTGTPLGEHVCEARVVGDCERLEQPAAGARQDDETATTEAPWPTVTDFSLEVWEGDTWVGVTFKRKTLDEARERRESFRRRFPEAQLRIVRWDETSTVVEADPGPAAGARQDGGRP